MENRLHISICIVVGGIVKAQVVLVVCVHESLVENAEDLVETVVHFAVQQRYLHDDAVVVQTIHKFVRYAPHHGLVLVIVYLVTYVYYRVFYLAYLMPEQINRHHRQGVAVGAVSHDILRILIVHSEILTEAKSLRGKPRLL